MTVALPSTASATVSGWQVTNWCAPVGACDSTRTYEQGMPIAMFRANGAKNCDSGYGDEASWFNGKTGYSNEGIGFFSSSYFKTLRWMTGEPVYCTGNPYMGESGGIRVPFRYFRYDTTGEWKKTPDYDGAWALGNAIANQSQKLTLTCADASGGIHTAYQDDPQPAASGSSMGTLFNGAYTAGILNSSASISMLRYNFGTNNWPIYNLINDDTNCAFVLSIKMEIATDTLGAEVVREWTGARAMSGLDATWAGRDPSVLDCAATPDFEECGGVAPHVAFCDGLDLVDFATWDNIAPCLIGGPEDYIGGATVVPVDMSSLPFPGTGSCAPLTPGDVMGAPLVIDMCGWYPDVRPIFDVIMTAGLWIAVAGAVIGTRTTGGD